MYSALLFLLFLPSLALAQNNSSSSTPSTRAAAAASTTITTTNILSSVGLGSGRVSTTFLSTQVLTTVLPLATGNITSAASSTSSTSSSPLPTAPTSVDGGGGQGGAPSPGAKGTGGVVYGPDDGYTAAASTLARNALGATLIASLVGGALAIF